MQFIKFLVLALILSGCSTAPPKQMIDIAGNEAYQKGLAEMKVGNYSVAEEVFRQIAGQYPEVAGPHANLGLLYQQQGRTGEAVVEFDAAIALRPTNAMIYNNAGVVYRSIGRFDDAEAAYLEAISRSSQYPDPLLNLAILYDIYLNQPKRALVYYQRYLKLARDDNEMVELWLVDVQRRASLD